MIKGYYITHPNIVNVYNVGQEEKVHYIVMEYVDGKNLKEIIKVFVYIFVRKC